MIKVLIVEDDPMVLEINSSYLNQIQGYKLAGKVTSVKDALSFLEENEVDLILLDIYMPEQDGLTFLTHIRSSQKDIDVILITAASDKNSIHRAIQNGAVDYIIKPFRFERLKQALVKYKEHRRLLMDKTNINQEELDRLINNPNRVFTKVLPPKGLTKHTLREIWSYIESKNGEEFSTEELVEVIGISRISIRKYLAFLENINVLSSHLSYGNIGRPLTMYNCKVGNEESVKPYIVD